MIVTDPPYGVSIKSSNGLTIQNGSMKKLLRKANARQGFDSIADQIEELREEKRQLLLAEATNEGVCRR